MQSRFRVVDSESLGLWWGRGCCIAYFMEVLEEVFWLHLSLVYSLEGSLRGSRSKSQAGQDQG